MLVQRFGACLASFNYYPSIPAWVVAGFVTVAAIILLRRRSIPVAMCMTTLVGAVSSSLAVLAGSGDMLELMLIPLGIFGGLVSGFVGGVVAWISSNHRRRHADPTDGDSQENAPA
ncbi:MAG: hypothetical protein VX404_02005 [Planctomycetota bacterium]|nr:hypothetical protein [Planctomycetota bacterium]